MAATILVTGVAGFIGSHVAEALVGRGFHVVGIDCFSDYYNPARKEENISRLLSSERFRLCRTDLSCDDLSPFLKDVDLVFHQAAQAGVRSSWGLEFDKYTSANVLATQRLLEAARARPIRRFVFASSSSVYGDTAELPLREDSRKKPYSPYGVTKLAAEHLGHLYRMNYGVPFVALRYFTVFGPRQRPDMALYRFIDAAHSGNPVRVFGSGEQTRDFTFVGDIVRANLLAAECESPADVYNIGGGERVSVNQAIRLVEEIVGSAVPRSESGREKGDVKDTWADCSAARNDLGFVPSVSFREGVEKMVAWYRQKRKIGTE